jgi:hypothetical protein
MKRTPIFGARNEDELRWMPTWISRFLTDPDFMPVLQEFSILSRGSSPGRRSGWALYWEIEKAEAGDV